MEAVEEMAAEPHGQNKDLSSHIAKGKRTKRHRPHSPIPFTIIPPTIALDANDHQPSLVLAPSSEDSTTTEEEDTARCLILLAQGHFLKQNLNKRYYETNTNNAKKAVVGGACMYTCKTCDRAFTSFQALGGHRASHKKPKNEKKLAVFEDFPSPKNRISSNSLSLQLNNISNTSFSTTPKSSQSPRIHECSYCRAEFTSGQALGGHMRRHRGGPISPYSNPPPPPVKSKNSQNGLSLDLNLPAPEDEIQKLGFAGTRQQKTLEEKQEQQQQNEAAVTRLVLSNTTTPVPLVDCHY